MTNQPREKQTNSDGINDISVSDGDHHADGFEQIGFLAARILSSVAKAREEAGEGNAVPSPAIIAQALEDVASNNKDSGGTERVVPARCLPIVKTQHAPVAEVSLGSKDRARRRSASR